MEVVRNDVLPLYKQVKLAMLKMIKTSYYLGEKLPSENDLSKQFNVSRITIRAAIKELDVEGWVKRYQGKGTYADHPKSKNSNSTLVRSSDTLLSWDEEMQLTGLSYETKTKMFYRDKVPKSVCDKWGLDWKETIVLRKVRIVNEKPILLINYINPKFAFQFTKEELLDYSLYDLFTEKLDLHVAKGREIVEARNPNKQEMFLLELSSPEAILSINRLSFSKCNECLVAGQLISLGQNYQYHSNISRSSLL